MWLTIVCTCSGEHDPIVIEFDTNGKPKGGVIQGNIDCWYSLFRWNCDHLRGQPEKKLLQYWNVRTRKFGTTNIGLERVQKALNEMGAYSHRPSTRCITSQTSVDDRDWPKT
jgi:hypothetical protein